MKSETLTPLGLLEFDPPLRTPTSVRPQPLLPEYGLQPPPPEDGCLQTPTEVLSSETVDSGMLVGYDALSSSLFRSLHDPISLSCRQDALSRHSLTYTLRINVFRAGRKQQGGDGGAAEAARFTPSLTS